MKVRIAVAVEVPPGQGPDLGPGGGQAEPRAGIDECAGFVAIDPDRTVQERDGQVEVTVAVEIRKRARERVRRREQLRLHRREGGRIGSRCGDAARAGDKAGRALDHGVHHKLAGHRHAEMPRVLLDDDAARVRRVPAAHAARVRAGAPARHGPDRAGSGRAGKRHRRRGSRGVRVAGTAAGLQFLRRRLEVRGPPSPDHDRSQCDRHGIPSPRPAFPGRATGNEGAVPSVRRRAARKLPQSGRRGRDVGKPRRGRGVAGPRSGSEPLRKRCGPACRPHPRCCCFRR